jgi:hypothetical protein
MSPCLRRRLMFVYPHLGLGLGLGLCLCLYSQPIPDTAAKTATRRVQYRTDYVQYKTEYVGAAPVARPLQTQQIQQYVEQRPAIAISSLSPRKYVEVWLFERGGARGVGCVGGRDSF